MKPICTSQCINGGVCTAPDTCQCLKGFSGSTCENVAKGYGWTEWMSRDNEGTGGDDERLRFLRESNGKCDGVVPSAIECRTVSGIPFDQSGQVVTCNRRLGLVCDQDDQPNRMDCFNYEVRLLCPEKSKVKTRTCTFNQLEYDGDERRTEGRCVECTCGGDGEWDCHQKDDPNCGIPVRPTDVPYPKQFNLATKSTNGKCYFNDKEYQPNEDAVLDCEICNCHGINGWQCTPKPSCTYRTQTPKCSVEKHFLFFHGHTATKGCNTCVCNAGSWQCTKMICPEPTTTQYEKLCYKPENGDERPVTEGTIVARDCNTCVCTRGKWDCTKHTCTDQTILEPKSCLDVDNKPHPHGTTITKDCNACTCRDGEFKCTHRYCSPFLYHNSTCVDTITGSVLKTGQTVKHGCNVCVCNSGNLTCTKEQCLQTNICFDERNRYDVTNHVIGVQYRPLCNQEGTFAATQCNEFTEICFCVTKRGQVIPGSRVLRKTPNCTPYTIFPAVIPEPINVPEPQMPRLPNGEFPKCRDYPTMTADIPDYFQPKCLDDGKFSPLQCNANTGYCFCVSSQGATVPGTNVHVTEGVPVCKKYKETTVVLTPTLTPCQDHRHIARLFKLPYVPDCDTVTGEYKARQCNPSNGQCVCVDINGMILKDTYHGKNVPSICDQYKNYELPLPDGVLPFTVPRVNSQGFYETVPFTFKREDLLSQTSKCGRQLRISEIITTIFTPQCESRGAFSPLQCPVNTGICFCVDVSGALVPDTAKISTSLPRPSCEQYRNVVLAPHNLTRTLQRTIILDLDKVGIQATKPRTSYVNKNVTVPSCIRQQQIANVVPGVFYPTCQNNGTFHPQQCHPISNKCFCVDRNGVEIQGTEMEISRGLPSCTQYWNVTQKVKEQHVIPILIPRVATEESDRLQRSATMTLPGTRVDRNCTKQVELASLLPGFPVPTCEPDGTYTALQCNATTGICYCSETDGVVVPDTVTPIILGTPSCWHLRNITVDAKVLTHSPEKMKPRYTACSIKQRAFNESTEYEKFFITYPECREDGSFEPVQCNPLRGLCFCVHTITGHKFEHTESARVPDCLYFEEKTCEWKGDKYYIGEQYYQDCNLCTCSGNNLAACTRMGCDETMCYANGQAFREGEKAKKDCNECTCIGAEWQCTTNSCPIEVPKTGLPVEPTFERGCMRRGIYHQKDTNFCDRCQDCTCIGGDWATCTTTQCMSFLCYHDCRAYYDGDQVIIDNTLHTCDYITGEFVISECVKEDGTKLTTGQFYDKDCNRCYCRDGGEFDCETNVCF
ncbi:uncharacterized protein [Amphiura filiformis]|uniref:uncharacterized protein n=1 Tax=Amphiura filiformis TaxID=82378 RepID=UPI003B216912